MRRKNSLSLAGALKRLTGVALVLAVGVVAGYPDADDTSVKVKGVELKGVNGSLNNRASAFGRYEFIAPYAPSISADEDHEFDLSELDNNVVYLIDSKKPDKDPIRLPLGNCYFPTRITYDEARGYLFVRGTEYRIEEDSEIEREVVARLRVSLDDDGKPYMLEQPVSIAVTDDDVDSVTPSSYEMFPAHEGELLILNDGYSIYSNNVIDGAKYPVRFGNRITYLDYDETSHTIVAGFTRREESEEGEVSYSTELFFYRLNRSGIVDLIRRVPRENFPAGAALMEGSTVALSVNPENQKPDFGFFIGSDGSLCQVDLRDEAGLDITRGTVDVMATVPELAVGEAEAISGREISFDRSKRMLYVVKKGVEWDIRRPSFARKGRPGRIRRPSFVRKSESPAIVVIQLNKRNKVVAIRVMAEEFIGKEGLSNLVFESASEGFIVAQTGELYSLRSENINDIQLTAVGNFGLHVDRISKGLSPLSFIGVSSFQPGGENSLEAAGALLFAKVKQ